MLYLQSSDLQDGTISTAAASQCSHTRPSYSLAWEEKKYQIRSLGGLRLRAPTTSQSPSGLLNLSFVPLTLRPYDQQATYDQQAIEHLTCSHTRRPYAYTLGEIKRPKSHKVTKGTKNRALVRNVDSSALYCTPRQSHTPLIFCHKRQQRPGMCHSHQLGL